MKDFLIGFVSGILVVVGWALWLTTYWAVGLAVILIAWFLGVVVEGHYLFNKKR